MRGGHSYSRGIEILILNRGCDNRPLNSCTMVPYSSCCSLAPPVGSLHSPLGTAMALGLFFFFSSVLSHRSVYASPQRSRRHTCNSFCCIKTKQVLHVMAEEGVTPDVITYNACLAACGRAGDFRRATTLMELMVEDGVDPDQRSYSAVISAAGRYTIKQYISCGQEKMKHVRMYPPYFWRLRRARIKTGKYDISNRVIPDRHVRQVWWRSRILSSFALFSSVR